MIIISTIVPSLLSMTIIAYCSYHHYHYSHHYHHSHLLLFLTLTLTLILSQDLPPSERTGGSGDLEATSQNRRTENSIFR
jgi:hypothetical protein